MILLSFCTKLINTYLLAQDREFKFENSLSGLGLEHESYLRFCGLGCWVLWLELTKIIVD